MRIDLLSPRIHGTTVLRRGVDGSLYPRSTSDPADSDGIRLRNEVTLLARSESFGADSYDFAMMFTATIGSVSGR